MYLDHNAALVVANGNVVRALLTRNTPDALQAIVKCVLQAVSIGVPDTHRTYCHQHTLYYNMPHVDTLRKGNSLNTLAIT